MNRAMRCTRKSDLAVLTLAAAFLALGLSAVGPSGRDRAQRAVCSVHLRQMTQAWSLYADDNDGKIVNGDPGEYTSMVAPGLAPELSHYQEVPWVFRDWMSDATLETKRQAILQGALFPYTAELRLYRCPLAEPNERRSYLLADSMNCRGWAPGVMIKNRVEIQRPGERFVYVDHGGTGQAALAGWTCYVTEDRWWDPPALRHNEGTNVSFADGHGEHWMWSDPRSVEFGRLKKAYSGSQPGNQDIRRAQVAVWGEVARR